MKVTATHLTRVLVPLLLAGCYFATSKLGFSMASDAEQVTLVWPPTGIALAALLLLGFNVWPGIALGAFLANVTANEPIATALFISIGNTLEAVTGAWLLKHLVGFQNNLGRIKDVLGLFLPALVSTMISATIGVISLSVGGVQPWENFASLWYIWWLGDAAGALIFAPVLLAWASPSLVYWSPRRSLEIGILTFILLMVCWSIFGESPGILGISGSAFVYLIFPFVIFAALRFGQRGTTLVTLIAAIMAAWATLHGFGPFTAESIGENLVSLQIFMAVVAVTGLLLSAIISERDKAGKEQARMAAIIASSEDAIVSKDLHGIVNFWNAAAERMFGYSAAEVIGRTTDFMIPPEFPAIEEQIMERLQRGERMEHYETVRIAKNGRHIHVSISASPIRNAAGKVIGVSKVVRDISERKWAEELLRESEARFRMMADAAPVLIWMAGTDKKCNYFNKPWLDFTGREIEQELGDGWTEGIHPDDMKRCIETYATSFDTRQSFAMEYRLRHHDGQYRWIMDYGAPRFTPKGEFAGYIGSCIDITARKKIEEALKDSDARKDEFLATLAHELRNPLVPLKNALSILKRSDAAQAQRLEAQHIMDNQLDHLVRLVDDLLDVSRISHGKIELRKKPVKLQDAIELALETAKPLIDAGGHQLSVTLPEEELWLNADITRLAQIFANLLNNAAKYTKHGGHIWLTATVENNIIVTKIRDDGIGIPPEMLSKIFDMFTQVDVSIERAHGGLGIGLMLVKTLVSMHGGTVSVSSQWPQQGSEFTVKLPLSTVTVVTHTAQPLAETKPAMRRLKILVVDDNLNLAKTMGWMIELMGHEVKLVHDGTQVSATAQEYQPDIVLMDIGLAGTNGYDIGKQLRREPSLQECILIAHTGWGQPEHRKRSKEAGFDYHLVKPVEMETLAQLFASIQSGSAAGSKRRYQ